MNTFFVALILALLVGFVFDLVFNPDRYHNWLNSARARRGIRRTVLKAVYSRRTAGPLQDILRSASEGDEILMVGRTQKGLLQDNEELITNALQRGAILKLLFLDLRALTNRGPGQRVDLRSLRLPNAYGQLVDDVGDAEAKLKGLQEQCRRSQIRGSLLVYRTDVLVQSSIVILAPLKKKTPLRLLYDLSFGAEKSDKFVQYYRSPLRESADDFCSRLHKFYVSLFDSDVSSFAYDLSYRYSQVNDPVGELEKIASERMAALIKKHDELEEIRNNKLVSIIPAARSVFHALIAEPNAPPPLSAQIELTNECSTSCTHCYRFSKTGSPHMDLDLAKSILSQLHEFGVRTITFSGGEPTRHPNFAEIMRYAAGTQNLAVGVLSNGVNVSNGDLFEIYRHAQWLRLSIDGSQNVYGEIRKLISTDRSAFHEVHETIKRFIHLNTGAPRCKLSICYTIQRRNADDVPHMIRWVRSLGLPGSDKCLTFKIAHGSNGFLCTAAQLKTLYSDVFNNPDFRDAANIPYLRWFLERQSSMLDFAKGRPTESLYLQQSTRCFTPHMFTLIDPRGDVYPCCFLFEDNEGYGKEALEKRNIHCVGSLVNSSFRDLWNGEKYQLVRDELTSINPNDTKYEACGQCTRHCNHNRGLSQLYAEYSGLHAARGDSDLVLKGVIGDRTQDEAWL